MEQAFPDALFHQLLMAMAHPDNETRIGAHSVFSIVLMPSLLSPQLDQETKMAQKVESESSTIHDQDFVSMKRKPSERKTKAGISGKYADNTFHLQNVTLALTDGKVV